VTDRDRPELDRNFQFPSFGNGGAASEADFAADLSAVQADDALLDALGGSDPKVADGLGDQELNALLLAWRRDIDSEPLAELVDTETAVTAVRTAASTKRFGQRERRRRMLVPVAAAAAVLAIAFTGTGLAARDAQPGDTLWGLTKVLYGDHARSVEAAATAKGDLEKANIALAGGRVDDARKALEDAQAALNQVSVEDNLGQLMDQHRQLSEQLQSPNPAPISTIPGSQGGTVPPASSQPNVPTSPPPSSQLPGTTTSPDVPTTSTTSPVESTTPPPQSSTTSVTGNDPGSSPMRNDMGSSDTPTPTPTP
jgi:hypothetical protein